MLTGRIKMFSKKDIEIISQLRNNARTKITKISRTINVPVTTIYDRVRAHEKKIVKKHTTLLDFSQLGFLTSAQLIIKVDKKSRDALGRFLLEAPNINTLYKTNYGSDFLAECIFRNTAELQNFKEQIEEMFNTKDIQVFNIVEELKKEEFLGKPEHFAMIH